MRVEKTLVQTLFPFQVFDARNSVLDAASESSSSRVNGASNAQNKSRDDSVVV